MTVKEAVLGSDVTFFGDQSFIGLPVGVFQGVVDKDAPTDPNPNFVTYFKGNSTEAGAFS